MITAAENETFHPNDGNPYWNESAWFSFVIPEHEINGWVYFWHRPNMNVSFGGVCLWDRSGEHAMDALYFDWDLHPLAEATGMHDFRWQPGLLSRCIEPLERYGFEYRNDGCDLDLEWNAVMEPHEVVFNKQSYGDFGNGHYDQAGRMKGAIKVYDRTFKIDCLSLRDRSWGPRHRKATPRVNYSWGLASEKDSFCIGSMAEHVNPDGSLPAAADRVTFGYYRKDGVVSDVSTGTMQVLERDKDGRPLRVTLSATDQAGRTLKIDGTAVAWLRFPGLTFIAYWWVMVKWRYEGRDVYGEVQDGWPMQEFRRYVRALR
jgi:hypothetical protein